MAELVVESGSHVFQDVLNVALRVPGVKINRNQFLRKTLSKYFQEHVVDLAIEYNPAKAGITTKELDRIAKSCISFETTKVTAISATAGVPGKAGMFLAVPADLTQYFAHVIIVLQKLIYLYGWKDIFNDDDGIDDETLNLFTLFLGVMFGVRAASVVIKKLAAQAAIRANNVIAAKSLTKGVIYPVVKRIAIVIGGKMNKRIFASGVSKLVPILGAATSGGLTYITFKPMAVRLKKHLASLPSADTNFYNDQSNFSVEEVEIDIIDITDSDFDTS